MIPDPVVLFASKSRISTKLRIRGLVTHKIINDHVNCYIDVTLCVDSEYVLTNVISLYNLEIHFKNLFCFCLPEAGFYSVGRRDMSKLTSKMESTHKKRLEIRRINYLRPVVRHTSGSPVISAFISKNMPGWFPAGY